MARTAVAILGLSLALIPAGARAGTRSHSASPRCPVARGTTCHGLTVVAPPPLHTPYADALSFDAPSATADTPDAASFTPSHTHPGYGSGKADFAPGESSTSGRKIVEWTLLTAPLAAYTLSPALDHRLHYESSGIWTRKYQLDFEHLMMLTEAGGALWYGGRSRIGKTFWRSLDASVFTAVTTTAMKYAFSRARPRQSKSPDRWFQGNCCQSFPSGEVSFQASLVTPFIAEYHKDHPWVWALEALPAYDAVARMKTHGHWQTDVLAAWAIGTAWGLYAHDEHNPLILGFMPHGVMVGLHVRF